MCGFFWICIGSSFAALVIFALVASITARNAILLNSTSYIQRISEQAAINLGNRLSTIEEMQHESFVNVKLYQAHEKAQTEDEYSRFITTALSSFWGNCSKYISSIDLIGLDDNTYRIDDTLQMMVSISRQQNTPELSLFENLVLGKANWQVLDDGSLVMRRVLVSPDDMKIYGYIQIMPRREYMDVLSVDKGDATIICLTDGNGNVWSSKPERTQIAQAVQGLSAAMGNNMIRVGSEEYLIVADPIGNHGLMQYTLVPTREILQELWTYMIWIGLASVGALGGVIALFFLLTRPVSTKMDRLLANIRQLSGVQQEPLPVSDDDFFELSGYFDALAVTRWKQ